MADINLIPDQYYYWRWQQRVLKQSAIAFVLLTVLTAVLTFALHLSTETRSEQLNDLRNEKAFSQQEQQQYEALNAELGELNRQWHVLTGLRGGTAMENIFLVIDRALSSEDIWFIKWEFKRAGYAVNPSSLPNTTADSGAYFITMDGSDNNATSDSAWAIETYLEVNGGALDHAALSDFVERLLAQPEINNVKVLSTAMMAGTNIQKNIDFRLAILINSKAGDDD